jgi:carbamoyl-phosphate synthase small subunit
VGVSAAGVLVLEDGAVFHGQPYGARGTAVGEVVFTTSMTGYQEVVTDPSYAGQLVAFTQPMIGNYGVEADVGEAPRPHAGAVIVRAGRNAAPGGREGFEDWLARHGVVGLDGVDTRALTRRIRSGGAMRGAVASGPVSPEELLAAVRAAPSMAGQALAGTVSQAATRTVPARGPERAHVALLDYGVKASIVRLLRDAGARVTLFPWDAPAADVIACGPSGVLLANGPGDPAALGACVREARALVGRVPLLGICLGHQVLGQALGLETFTLRFGHRGANHPVLELAGRRVLVTAQNHGFAVRAPADGSRFETPLGAARVTHVSLYDGTVEGLELLGLPVSSLQFHPEASPGPHDARPALARFVETAAEAARA